MASSFESLIGQVTNPDGSGSLTKVFSDPFLLEADRRVPRNLKSIYDFSLFLAYLNPRFVNAICRKLSFFITDIELKGDELSADESQEFKEKLMYDMGLFALMNQMAVSYAVYGNAYVLAYAPFDRYLKFENGIRADLRALQLRGIPVSFDAKNFRYKIRFNDKEISADFVDIRASKHTNVRFRCVDPARIHLIHNVISCHTQYIYDFEPTVRTQVKNGNMFILNEIPIDMLRALNGEKDFLFDDGMVFHFKVPAAPGIAESGLGLPPPIEHFRPLYKLQVYRKIDEAIGLDYMLPFRIFSPAAGDNYNDFIKNHDLAVWRQSIKKIIDSRRVDKFAMHSLPFPVTYQEFGAQGKALAPKDVMEWQQNDTLAGAGYPVELFNASLAWQAMPMALRLFESENMIYYHEFNRFVKWASKRVTDIQKTDPVDLTLQRPTIADNIERRNLLLQLQATGEVSRATGLEPLGIADPVGEAKRRMQEDVQIERERVRSEEEFRREVEAGQVGLSAEAESGGAGGVTPQDVNQQAMQLAEQWAAIPDDGQRSIAMQQVRVQDEQLYALAKQKMEEIRSAGASQGRQAAMQSYQQGGAPPPAM